MRRMVSVWLPDWPITVFRRARTAAPAPPDASPSPCSGRGEQAPFALTLRTGRGLALHAVDPAARRLGLRRGQAHADARAIAPSLVAVPAEPEAEVRALHALAL